MGDTPFHCYSNFLWLGSHAKWLFLSDGTVIWGMGKRNAKMQKYEKLQFFFFSPSVFIKKQNNSREAWRGGGTENRRHSVCSSLLTVFTGTRTVATFGIAFG